MNETVKQTLQRGVVIPAVPLALTADRCFDERRERALLRYYGAAGVGGLAVGVHTTQFAIRDPEHGLFGPVLKLAAHVMDEVDSGLEGHRTVPLVRVGGICGETSQAVREARLLRELRYHAGLLNVGAMRDQSDDVVISHCRKVAEVIPLFGFYLNVCVGGRELPYSFWRKFAEIQNVVGIKIACFDRYKTVDCIRAIADAGRDDISLYTGNDDHIIIDLVTPFRFSVKGTVVERRFVGGLLGHWAVWTKRAVEHLKLCHDAASSNTLSSDMLVLANEVTDANGAFFDPAHRFAGCIAGLHYVLKRQGLFANDFCLNPDEQLSPGQADDIDRVWAAYPHLNDDEFVAANLDRWLK
ncbi:MAG TPA: dihydrodipicolinate synthase family protein [Lacipirellulaceae bacterium]|jgi:dihydrodipicolinate synthase/N-acetylneuraminate lyase|nr:dihydrodipicolinate synthase family protein [Lacipirellulaceae bacterium]